MDKKNHRFQIRGAPNLNKTLSKVLKRGPKILWKKHKKEKGYKKEKQGISKEGGPLFKNSEPPERVFYVKKPFPCIRDRNGGPSYSMPNLLET